MDLNPYAQREGKEGIALRIKSSAGIEPSLLPQWWFDPDGTQTEPVEFHFRVLGRVFALDL